MTLTVLVVDMQNGFCRPDGSAQRAGMSIPDVDEVISECSSLIAEARAAHIPVVYTRHTYRPGHLDAPPSIRPQLAADAFIRGSWDAAIVDELKPGLDDAIIDKARFDAFAYTDLELVLRGLETSHLLIAGVVTNMCVETTARSAQQRDFQVTVAKDATGSVRESLRDGSFLAMQEVFISVAPWASVPELSLAI
jgi:ureidoacrylate peracid hydrolase